MPSVAHMVVFIVFFGPLPVWWPVTLFSMRLNANVSFVIVSDQRQPTSSLPANVWFEHIAWTDMQVRVSQLVKRDVRYDKHYKANDLKPLLPELFPQYMTGCDWWAWADMDVIFGDLLKYMTDALEQPACCRGLRRKKNVYWRSDACPCAWDERVSVVTPLHPNPWRKATWGPFTAFRKRHVHLFRRARGWNDSLHETQYTHFDEWWGEYRHTRRWETMGDVVDHATTAGDVVLSARKLPYAEARSCDGHCAFCPCGALRARLRRVGLSPVLAVNDVQVMLLHLGESKPGWSDATLPESEDCVAINGLGNTSASRRDSTIRRHRVYSSSKIIYPATPRVVACPNAD